MKSLARVGKALFPYPMVVLYDGRCTLCRRTMGILGSLDVLDQLIPINALSENARTDAGVDHLDPDLLLQAMHVVAGGRVWSGFEACRAIAWRVPLLWPVAPLLHLWPVPAIGRRLYRRVAASRTCQPPGLGAPGGAGPTDRTSSSIA